jgi:hypothetical protein
LKSSKRDWGADGPLLGLKHVAQRSAYVPLHVLN